MQGLELNIRRMLANSFEQMIQMYGESEMSDLRMTALAGGLRYAVIRKLLIRPFFHFENRYIQNEEDEIIKAV